MATSTITRQAGARHIAQGKAFVDRTTPPPPEHYRAAKDARSRMLRLYHDENVVRCHRCPPTSFCASCQGLNAARIKLGLIRPKHQEDHANNILYPLPLDKKGRINTPTSYAFGKRFPVITACLRQLGGGWRQGRVLVDGKEVDVGPKTQSQAEAWAWAKMTAASVRDGVRYELGLPIE